MTVRVRVASSSNVCLLYICYGFQVKLFTEWCRIAPDDPTFRARFKAMGFIDKIERFGLPYMCSK